MAPMAFFLFPKCYAPSGFSNLPITSPPPLHTARATNLQVFLSLVLKRSLFMELKTAAYMGYSGYSTTSAASPTDRSYGLPCEPCVTDCENPQHADIPFYRLQTLQTME